jgi:hypothetical protein
MRADDESVELTEEQINKLATVFDNRGRVDRTLGKDALIDSATNPETRRQQAIEFFGAGYFDPIPDPEVEAMNDAEQTGVDAVADDGLVYGTPIELLRYKTIYLREKARRAALERRVRQADLVPYWVIEQVVFDPWKKIKIELEQIPRVFRQRFPGLEEEAYEHITRAISDTLLTAQRYFLGAKEELITITKENGSLKSSPLGTVMT